MANFVISERKPAPGISECFSSQASNRAAMPLACGIPPTPAGSSITRLLSVTANCPSRKNPSRGVVAIQLGLPRLALRKADWVARDVAFASLMSSSLISNGLRASNFFSVRMSAITCSSFFAGIRRQISPYEGVLMSGAFAAHQDLPPLGQQNYQHHAPDGEQRVSDGIGDGVTETGNLALGAVVDHAERGCRGARTGATAEHNSVVEPEQIFADIHRSEER